MAVADLRKLHHLIETSMSHSATDDRNVLSFDFDLLDLPYKGGREPVTLKP